MKSNFKEIHDDTQSLIKSYQITMHSMPFDFNDRESDRINNYRKRVTEKAQEFDYFQDANNENDCNLLINLSEPQYKKTLNVINDEDLMKGGEFPLEFQNGLDCKGIVINQLYNLIDWIDCERLLVAISNFIYVFNPDNSKISLQCKICNDDFKITQCRWLRVAQESNDLSKS